MLGKAIAESVGRNAGPCGEVGSCELGCGKFACQPGLSRQ